MTTTQTAGRRLVMTVHGVGYGVATRQIEQEIRRVPGVAHVQVTPGLGAAQVVVEGTAPAGALEAAARRLGFNARVAA